MKKFWVGIKECFKVIGAMLFIFVVFPIGLLAYYVFAVAWVLLAYLFWELPGSFSKRIKARLA